MKNHEDSHISVRPNSALLCFDAGLKPFGQPRCKKAGKLRLHDFLGGSHEIEAGG